MAISTRAQLVRLHAVGVLSWLSGCVGTSANTDDAQEKPVAAPTVEMPSRPVSNQPTTLSIELDGETLTLPASARLQLGVDGNVEFSASSQTAENVFSMRLAVPSGTARLTGTSFDFELGLESANQLALVRGALPNATSWRSVAGSARFMQFSEEHVGLSFDAMLSRDPRTGAGAVHVAATLTGVASLVCLQRGAAAEGGHVDSEHAEPQIIMGAPRGSALCQPLMNMLDED